MKHIVKLANATMLEISVSSVKGEPPSCVYIKVSNKKIAKTEALDELVFADFDAKGDLVGIEFAEPESLEIGIMAEIARKVHVPLLRAIDVGAMAVCA